MEKSNSKPDMWKEHKINISVMTVVEFHTASDEIQYNFIGSKTCSTNVILDEKTIFRKIKVIFGL